MISVGIDVSKGKSTVCILKPYGEIVASPFEVRHTESDLKYLIQMIQRLDGEIRIVMEATGIYHLPMLSSLQDQNLFVAVINPFEMKEYASRGLRRVKTDKTKAFSQETERAFSLCAHTVSQSTGLRKKQPINKSF